MSQKQWEAAANYYCKDFNWDELRQQVENDPSLQFHLLPFSSKGPTTQSQEDAESDSQAWNQFHARHSTGEFFKHYLLKEFPELASCPQYSKVLEVGCGNGSTALPMLRGRESILLYACDCSDEALERAKEIITSSIPFSETSRFHTFQCDFSTTGFPSWLVCKTCSGISGTDNCHEINDLSPLCSDEKNCIAGVDFVTLIFTLSAVPVDRMREGITQCFAVLKPGGFLLFMDYGLYDMTMLRFEPEQRVGYREYMRSLLFLLGYH